MDNRRLSLGMDFGTSGLRIAVINNKYELILTASLEYTIDLSNPEEWIRCAKVLISNLSAEIRENIVSIAVDGTSGTLLACDYNGSAIGKAIPYYQLCPEQNEYVEKIVQNHLHAASNNNSLAKALRLIDKSGPNVLLRHQADWITGWLINNWRWGEASNNLKMGWDNNRSEWPLTLKKQSWINALPEIVNSGTILSQISKTKAIELGLGPDTFVVAGTTDSNAAVLATEAEDDDGITILGSTLVIKHFVNQPIIGEGITNHLIGEKWLCGGSSNTGCAVLKKIFDDEQIQELSTQIDPKKSSGISFLPLAFTGERFPTNDPLLEAKVEPRPISDALYLHALLEGITNIELKGWNRLNELGVNLPKRIITIGGGAKNPQWKRIRERMLNTKIITCNNPPAKGVAKIAMKAILDKL